MPYDRAEYQRTKLRHAEVRYRNACKAAGIPFTRATDDALVHIQLPTCESIPRPYDASGQEYWVVLRGVVAADGGPICLGVYTGPGARVAASGRARSLTGHFQAIQTMLPAHVVGFTLAKGAALVYP